MWFGCRTESQDLLHSTPCPDGILPCPGDNPVPCGESCHSTGCKEHGKGLQNALKLKDKILDLK